MTVTVVIYFIQLEEVAQMSHSVELIPLPERDKDIAAKSTCSVAGWGAIKTNGSASHLLLQADVVIMKREKCKKIWNLRKTYVSEKNICTRVGAGFCQVSFNNVWFIQITVANLYYYCFFWKQLNQHNRTTIQFDKSFKYWEELANAIAEAYKASCQAYGAP